MGIENFTAGCFYLQDVLNAARTVVRKTPGTDLSGRLQQAGMDLSQSAWSTAIAHQVTKDTGNALAFTAKAAAGRDPYQAMDNVMQTGYMLEMRYNPWGFNMMNPMFGAYSSPMGFGSGYNPYLYSGNFMYMV